MTDRLTYRDAGVARDRADVLVERIAKIAKATHGRGVLSGVGGFASLFALNDAVAMKEPLLVAGTDGVGTKLQVAFMMNVHDTVGIDLVAMCVNDVITCGARPLFFLDYIGTASLDVDRAEAVVRGVAEGCRRAECALVGGETAQMPGLYQPGEYDLAGFAVGVVDRAQVIDGKRVRPKDVLIGVMSRGLHSNGFSLARKALFERQGWTPATRIPDLPRTIGEELLEPTAIYAKLVRALMDKIEPKAIAHITGSGIPGNLPRVLPDGTKALIDRSSWSTPAIFRVIQRAGSIEDEEMFATFNMGIGLVVVTAPEDVSAALFAIGSAGETARVVGEIAAGPGGEAFVEIG